MVLSVRVRTSLPGVCPEKHRGFEPPHLLIIFFTTVSLYYTIAVFGYGQNIKVLATLFENK